MLSATRLESGGYGYRVSLFGMEGFEDRRRSWSFEVSRVLPFGDARLSNGESVSVELVDRHPSVGGGQSASEL